MRENEIRAINCPKERCKNCQDASNLECMNLKAFQEEASMGRVLLVEAERGLIHFAGQEMKVFTQPPWHHDGWESVYVGSDTGLIATPNVLLDIYPVGPYLSVFFSKSDEQDVFHEVYPIVRSSLELGLIDDLFQEISDVLEKQPASRVRLTDRLHRLKDVAARRILESLPEINEVTRERISMIVANRSTVLGPLIPVLLDDEVEEIYMDKPDMPLYFDHARHGRCVSSLFFDKSSVSRLTTLIRAESNLHLDRRNPSLKTDFDILGTSLRVSVSTPPLTPDGLHLEIRRARQKPFSIIDLIRNDTLTLEAAAVLLLAISCRFNITITGEPGCGKTTLMNALDMSSPRSWRKVYIEDAIESRVQHGHHQVRIRVDPFDEMSGHFDKTSEIVKSLHRSPDYLILGEIQTAEHNQALFQALAAGLRTIQTCHSFSASSLITRWMFGHGIKDSSLGLMDLIVNLKRPIPGESRRIVSEIVEVRKDTVDGFLRFQGLNTIYSNHDPDSIVWADDGAFQFHAKQAGSSDHVPAYETIINHLREEVLSTLDAKRFHISEKLWESGHPMRYVEN